MKYDPEKVGRAMKTLAQLPFSFWREYYGDKVIADERSAGHEQLTAYGTLQVLIASSTEQEKLVLVNQKHRYGSPSVYLSCDGQKVAEYEGKLHPPYVYNFVLADDTMTGLEEFSHEVKKKFDSWR